MICVSLGRTRHKMVLAEHRALAERGAKLVELRLDWLSHLPDLGRLLKDRPTPVVVTCRRPRDKGLWKFTEEQRLMLLRSAIVSGAEYVDLEEDIAKSIPRYGQTRRIVSYHNFDTTPPDIDEIHARLSKLDPDVVKIVTMANVPADNVRMLQLVQQASVPTVGFCMGDYGVPSRILTGRYGAPFTYATFDRERTMAPGQLTFEEMRDIYRYDQIDSDTAIYGVAADPVAHSLSPQIHNAALAHAGINGVYLPLRIPADKFAESLKALEWLPVQGYSVTLPHKEAVLEITGNRDEPVAEIGAANTLYRGPEGGWRLANTDYEAAMQSLSSALRNGVQEPGADATHPLSGKKVLLLGAGGVARALAMGIVRHGGGLMVSNRTRSRAEELSRRQGCLLVQWENRGAAYADALVNCTSVGLHPHVNETPFAENWLREGMVVFDTIYNPERTLLIKEARERGCKTVTGVDMFVQQAARQFELFTGRSAPIEVMRSTMRQAISAARSA
ncbi:MAG: shikimate dehydrogenase [Planctomycetales bacterium]